MIQYRWTIIYIKFQRYLVLNIYSLLVEKYEHFDNQNEGECDAVRIFFLKTRREEIFLKFKMVDCTQPNNQLIMSTLLLSIYEIAARKRRTWITNVKELVHWLVLRHLQRSDPQCTSRAKFGFLYTCWYLLLDFFHFSLKQVSFETDFHVFMWAQKTYKRVLFYVLIPYVNEYSVRVVWCQRRQCKINVK